MKTDDNTLYFARDAQTGKPRLSDTDFAQVYKRLIRKPGTVGREFGDLARAFLVDKTNELKFATPGRDYEEASIEVNRRYPQIATLAFAPIGDDNAFYRAMSVEWVDCQ